MLSINDANGLISTVFGANASNSSSSSKVRLVKIWENAVTASGSKFESQTVKVPIYDYYLIAYEFTSGTGLPYVRILKAGGREELAGMSTVSYDYESRTVTNSVKGELYFRAGKFKGSENNTYGYPVAIYGIEGVTITV